MLITNQVIFNELQEIKKLLKIVIDRDNDNSIEEISLSKVCKLLHLGSDSVLQLVKNGSLKARVSRDQNKKTRYRFRIADVKKFQNTESISGYVKPINDVESSESIAQRIFKLSKKK